MTNKFLKPLLFLVLFVTSCSSKNDKWQWIENLPKPWTLSEAEVSKILPEFHKKYPKFEDRLKAITLWRISTPYEIFKLGEEMEPDTDPLFRLDVSDCTVHVLTSLTLAQSNTWDEARNNIIKIHYKTDENGNQIPTYKSRWHFTSDRILSNPNTVNITNELVDSTELKKIALILNSKNDGSELLELDWSRNVELSYISNININSELLKKLPSICGIAFVKETYFNDGLVIAHEGIMIDQKSLIHASSVENKTLKIDFLDYYFTEKGAVFDGIMIYKFVPFE